MLFHRPYTGYTRNRVLICGSCLLADIAFNRAIFVLSYNLEGADDYCNMDSSEANVWRYGQVPSIITMAAAMLPIFIAPNGVLNWRTYDQKGRTESFRSYNEGGKELKES